MEAAQKPNADLVDALGEFFRAARRARGRASQAHSQDELSLSQFQLLEPLLDAPHATGQLAVAAGVSPPTATRMLDGLVERGWVERAAVPGDRRAVQVALTPAGRRIVRARRRRVIEVRSRIAAAIDPSERELAADVLRRLAAVMEEL